MGLARLGHGLVARGALAAGETPPPVGHIKISHVSQAPQKPASENNGEGWWVVG